MTDRPDRIGRYEVLSTLGQGGMGVLYLALWRSAERLGIQAGARVGLTAPSP